MKKINYVIMAFIFIICLVPAMAVTANTYPYWISDNNTSFMYINVTTDAVNNFTYVYENGSTAKSNGTATFLLYDDFNDGTLDATKWNNPGATCSETGGYVQCTGSTTTNYLYSVKNFTILNSDSNAGFLTIGEFKQSGQYSAFGFSVGTTTVWSAQDTNGSQAFFYSNTVTDVYYNWWNGAATLNSGWNPSGANTASFANFSIWTRNNISSITIGTQMYNMSIAPNYTGIYMIKLEGHGTAGTGYFNYIGIGKKNSVQPTIAYNPKENGTWVINGETYTQRTKINITGVILSNTPIPLNYSKFSGTKLVVTNSTAAADPEVENITMILKSYSGTVYSSISNFDDFIINANWTNQSGVKLNGICNFTAYNNISYTQELRTFTDVNFTSPTQQISMITGENTTGVWYDKIKFNICETGSGSDFDIYINGSLFRTILSAQIPLCSGRTVYHEENNITGTTINAYSLNITVKCSGLCGIANRAVTLLYDDDGGTLHYYRRFNQSPSESLTYNVTSKLYSHAARYLYDSSPLNISVTCNGSTFNFTQVVTLNNLTFVISDLNDMPFVNGMQIESNYSYNITTDISGGHIVFEQINVSRSNGTLLVSSNNTESLLINGSVLNLNGIYNISVYAISESGVTYSNNSFYFIMNDTIYPYILYYEPLNNSVHYLNEEINTNIFCSDINLYAYELDIYAPNGSLFKSWNETGLTYNKTIIQTFIPSVKGRWFVATYCSDSHTTKAVKEIPSKIDNSMASVVFYHREKHSGKYSYGNLTISDKTGDYLDLILNKTSDRYTFEYHYSKPKSKLYFEISAPGWEYIEDEYPGHFASLEAYQWLDFNSSVTQSVKINQISDNVYGVDVTLIGKYDKVIFRSIGGLNVNNVNITFNVTDDPAESAILRPGVCPETTEGQLSLFGAYILLFIVLIIGLKFKAAIVSVFASLGMIGLALVSMACSSILGFAMIIIAALLFFISLTRKLF